MALGDRLPDERDRSVAGLVEPEDEELEQGGDLDVQEQEDGGAIVRDAENEEGDGTEFDANLAEEIDENEMDTIARDLMIKIEYDKQSRLKRDEQYEEGLRRTGLSGDAPGGAMFTGASKAVHPMLTEAAVDFAASAMKELFPPSGPVKTEIIGDQTPEKLEISDRQFRYMNWQLTEQIEEYPEELEVTLTQLPMGGSQYMKFWDDDTEGRPVCEFVPIDDMLIPYACTSFWSAHRITHVQRLNESVFEERVESEMYRDLEMAAPSETPEQTRAGKASEKIEGVEQPAENLDGIRLVYEVNTYLRLSIDKEERLPYLISIDERTSKVLSIYRNWEEDDKRRKRLHWIVDYGFIPWRGAYKLGLAQMIGGLSAAATGALRALLDSALVQTIPVLAKMKGAKFGAQSKQIDPLSMIEVEAGTTMDDIRKVLMALPFNAPSPVLFQLLGWLTDAAKGVVTTAEEKIADAGNQMPVGTSLALIEQGAKVFSSIHSRLHRSQKKALLIIARMNKNHIDKESQIEKFGEVICTEEDFSHPLGVIPVSDPNIFSEGQRYAQMQIVSQNLVAFPQLHSPYDVLYSQYKLAKIPDIDKILPPPKKPTEMNAAAENSSVMLGSPVMAFPEQEHLAHLETHMRFIIDPLFGGSPAAVPMAWPPMIEHIKQHLSFLYAKEMHQLASEALGQDVSELMKDKKNWGKVDALLAAASRLVHAKMAQVLAPLGPVINQMIQKIESMKPPAPMDPSQAALQVAKLEDQRSRDEHKDDSQISVQELEEKKRKDAADAAAKTEANRIKEKDVDLRHGLGQDKIALDAARTGHDQAMDIAGHHQGAAQQAHAQSLDVAGHEMQRDAQNHSQTLDAAGHELQRDQQAHGQSMDHTDRALNAQRQAHDIATGTTEQHLKRGGQEHDQVMDVANHDLERQRTVHEQRMGEADHAQRQTEHKDGMQQADRARKDENRARDADRKAAAAKANAAPKKDK